MIHCWGGGREFTEWSEGEWLTGGKWFPEGKEGSTSQEGRSRGRGRKFGECGREKGRTHSAEGKKKQR